MAGSGRQAESGFQIAAEACEGRRQLPVTVDRGMVQRGGFSLQNDEKMAGFQHPFVLGVTPGMGRHHGRSFGDDVDSVDIPLHGHVPKRPPPGDAVTVAVERHGLIFIHRTGKNDAGVKRMDGRSQGRESIPLEPDLHRLGVPPAGPFASGDTTVS